MTGLVETTVSEIMQNPDQDYAFVHRDPGDDTDHDRQIALMRCVAHLKVSR